jgi:hypothetical protein
MDMRNIDDKIGQFFSKVKMLTAFDGCELDLTAADMKYITGQMPLIKQALELRMPDLKKEYEELMNLYDFMQQYKNYLPNCPKSVVDDISDIQSRHKINFAKLRALRPVFTPAEVSV